MVNNLIQPLRRVACCLGFQDNSCIVKLLQALASNLKVCRKEAGLTQRELAQRAGLDYKHYQKVELGTWPGLRVDTVERLANALGLRAWDLIKPSESDLRQEQIRSQSRPPNP